MRDSRTRSLLRLAAAAGLTALLTAFVLLGLLTRLGDAAGAWWAGRAALLFAVTTLALVTALALTDAPARDQEA